MDDQIVKSHLTSSRLDRLVSRGLSAEEERLLSRHLMGCENCRARALDALGSIPRDRRSLRGVVALAESEFESRIASLLSAAEWEVLRRLPKTAQTNRLILSRVCHSREFLQFIIGILQQTSTKEEAELVAKLASLAIKGLAAEKAETDHLSSQVLIELANSRRLAAEWEPAEAALERAKNHLGDEALLQARWLSIFASLQNDKGDRTQALETLTKCRQLYEQERDWNNVAKTLVKMGHVLSDLDPLRGLSFLDQARPLIPASDPILLWLLEINAAECFIETSQVVEGLRAYLAAEDLKRFQPQPKADIRSKFTAGRLLESLGYRAEAERLFRIVVNADLEHSLVRDGFLDLLYLFTFYVKGGEPDRAAALGRQALKHLDLLGSVHEQIKEVWQQLIHAADTRTLDVQMLPRIREYLRVWWKRPGPEHPFDTIANSEFEGPKADCQVVFLEESRVQSSVVGLLARAKWEELRRLPRTVQEGRLGADRLCHTPEFLDFLFTSLKQPVSSRDAETLARLATLAVKVFESTAEGRQRMAQIWIELANSRRLSAEWESAEVALQRASEGVAEHRLLRARWLSVSASLRFDKGDRAEALRVLTQSRHLYELEGDWYQVARTLVKLGMFLVDTDPLLGLKVLDQAQPFMNFSDPILLWLLEINRTECFIETNQTYQALSAFRAAEELRRFQPKPKGEIRSKFTSGRLLEALGYRGQAEHLFEEVVSADLEHSFIRDSFLDLLYLFAFYAKGGELDRAASVGRRALNELELLDSVHEQLGDVWRQLILAAERRSLDLNIVPAVREYLRVWWKRPGPSLPVDLLGSLPWRRHER